MKSLLILLLVVVIGVGLYIFFMPRHVALAPTPEATSSATTSSTQTPAMQKYTNDQFGISFAYPVGVMPTSTFQSSYLATADWSLLAAADHTRGKAVVAASIPHSNEIEAGQLRIGVSTSTAALARCLIPPAESGVGGTSSVDINGQQYTAFAMSDAAMSHHLQGKIYRTVYDNACYSIEAVVFGTDPLVYDPPRTAPFTLDQAFTSLNTLVQSITLTKPTSASVSAVATSSPEGMHCGGFIQNAPTCPANYHCQLGHIPDAGGVCVAN